MDPEGVSAAVVIFIMSSAIILFPVARAYARRLDRSATPSQLTTEVTQRLERMEHAIDSIAVEVERISEGQRFTTKLLAERREPELARSIAAPTPRS